MNKQTVIQWIWNMLRSKPFHFSYLFVLGGLQSLNYYIYESTNLVWKKDLVAAYCYLVRSMTTKITWSQFGTKKRINVTSQWNPYWFGQCYRCDWRPPFLQSPVRVDIDRIWRFPSLQLTREGSQGGSTLTQRIPRSINYFSTSALTTVPSLVRSEAVSNPIEKESSKQEILTWPSSQSIYGEDRELTECRRLRRDCGKDLKDLCSASLALTCGRFKHQTSPRSILHPEAAQQRRSSIKKKCSDTEEPFLTNNTKQRSIHLLQMVCKVSVLQAVTQPIWIIT